MAGFRDKLKKEGKLNNLENTITKHYGIKNSTPIGPKQNESKAMWNEIQQRANNSIEKSDSNNLFKNFFQKSKAFEDGYDMFDVSKTVANTAFDAVLNVAKGIEGIGTGLSNAGAGVVAQVADWIDTDKSDEFADRLRRAIAANDQSIIEDYYEENGLKLGKNSVLGDTSEAVLQGVGQSVATAATGLPTMFASSLGNNLQQGYSDENYKNWEVWLDSVGGAAVDTATESLFDTLGIGGSKFSKNMKSKFISQFKSGMGKGLAKAGISAFGEGSEEVLSYIGNWILDNGIGTLEKVLGEGDGEKWKTDLSLQEMFENFTVGALSSLLTESASMNLLLSEQTKDTYSKLENLKGEELTDKEKREVKKQVRKSYGDYIQAQYENEAKQAEKQGSTIENKRLLEQEQQTTLPEGKTPENTTSQEIEKNEENQEQVEQNVEKSEPENENLNEYVEIVDGKAYNKDTSYYKNSKKYVDAENKIKEIENEIEKIKNVEKKTPTKNKREISDDEVAKFVVDELGLEDDFNSIQEAEKQMYRDMYSETLDEVDEILDDDNIDYKKIEKLEKELDKHRTTIRKIQKQEFKKQFENKDVSLGKETSKQEFEGFETKTTIPHYDEMLLDNEDAKSKGYSYVKVVEMTPLEYLNACSKYAWETPVQDGIDFAEQDKISRYAEDMKKGDKFPMPVLDLKDHTQEGRHRALTAQKNGIKTIPVLIVSDSDVKGVKNEQERVYDGNNKNVEEKIQPTTIENSTGNTQTKELYRLLLQNKEGNSGSGGTNLLNNAESFNTKNSQNEGSILLPENNTLPQIDEDIEAFKEETANLDKEQKQRGYPETVIKSDYVSKEAKKSAKKVLKNDTYTPVGNNESIEKATKKINNSGLDAVYTSFVTKFDNNERMTLDDIVEAEILIQQYSYNGETDKAEDLIRKVAVVGTELGQMIQAMSIIKKSTPLSQLQVAEKIIERLNIEYDADIQLSEETLKKIKEADMDDIQDIMTEAYAEIGEQLPLTFSEKLHNFRYLAMLGNPKTHIKNKSGNIAMHILNNIKNEVSGTIQDIYSKFNDDYTQTNTIKRANSDQKTFAKEDAELMKDSIDSVGNKYSESPNSIVTQNKRYFDNKILNALAKFNSERLDKADKKALRWAYKDAMQDYMAANDLTSDMLKEDERELRKARDFAINQALEATFHQYNFLASKLNDIERNGGLVGGAVSAILPFKKTPLNILKTGMEYSPAGLLNAGVNFVTKNQKAIERLNRELNTGKITEQEFNEKKSSIINKNIDEFSKGLTGSALALIGYAMANAKFLKAGNDDEEEEFEETLGKQKYSLTIPDFTISLGKQKYPITIGDYNISLDWLSPSAMPLFMGAEVYDALQKDEDISKISALTGGVLSAFNPAFETTMLSNVTSALTSYSSDAEGKWENIIANILTNYITSYISSGVTNLYKTLNPDTTIRSTTSTKTNTTDRAIDTTWNNIKSRLPVTETYELLKAGADAVGLELPESEDTMFSQLPAKVDSYGQAQTREDNILLRMVSNFINPATVNEISDVDAEITQEIERLNRETETNVLPKLSDKSFTINSEDYRMSNEEYAKAKETYGKTYYETVNALIDNDTYNKLSDDEKATLISDIKSYARENAKAEYAENAGIDYTSTNEMYNSFKAVEKAGGNAEDYVKYLVETNGMTDKAEKLNYLNSQGYTTKVKNAIYENDIGSNTYVSRSKDEKFNALNAIQGKVSDGYTLYVQKSSEEAFKGDKGATGWEAGSKRNKLKAFLQDKSNGLTNIERYYIATFEGQAKYLLTSTQRNKLRQYLKDNKSKLDAETYNKMIDKLNEADK